MAIAIKPAAPARHGAWARLTPDALIVALFAVAATALSLQLSSLVDMGMYGAYARDVWFQADLDRVVANMLHVDSDHFRTKVHPLTALLLTPLARALQAVWPGSDGQTAARLEAMFAGAWAAMFFALLRRLELSRLAAAAFTTLAMSTSAWLFYFGVPELYGPGSLTIVLVLLVSARLAHGLGGPRTIVFASAASLSMTVTNWMAGLALAAVHLPWRVALKRSLQALVIVALLALVQKQLFPTSNLFFLGSSEELRYVNDNPGGGLLHRLAALFLHAAAMPSIASQPGEALAFWNTLSVQNALPGSRAPFGLIGVVGWSLLLALGAWGMRRVPPRLKRFRCVLLLTLAGQVALHLVYGEETFLYGLHVLPLLVAVAAMATYTPLGHVAPWAAFALSAVLFANNLAAFKEAAAHTRGSPIARETVQRVMAERPKDVWPRSSGHVVLAQPGSALIDKAYVEPGGNFSPAPGSFGVSIRVTDLTGRLIAASETMPITDVKQSFAPRGNDGPALVTQTPWYTATWSLNGGHWQLNLQSKAAASQRLWLVVRSVGPSGGPLASLQSRGDALVANGAWQLTLDAPATQAALGNERHAAINLVKAKADAASLEDAQGWLFAAWPVSAREANLRIERVGAAQLNAATAGTALPQAVPRLGPLAAWWQPQVPDARFGEMAYAQQAHLLMGLTENQTRPGDPLNYDSEWTRDGAYTVVALARAGQLDAARQLVRRFAEQDFLGGFGAEADAPGFALWAIGEVGSAASDRAFDAAMWPHVQRKVAFIRRCIDATGPVRAEPSGPLHWRRKNAPLTDQPCEAAREGLIVGRMDQQYPYLFVNAVSLLGLREAAAFARRAGHSSEATSIDAAADALQAAWRKRLLASTDHKLRDGLALAPELIKGTLARQGHFSARLLAVKNWVSARDNDRTYISAAWPSFAVGADDAARSAVLQGLEQRWRKNRKADASYVKPPMFPYFELAEAHQWLLLGRSDRAWATLSFMMDHSATPGLHTLWEGHEEENTSNRWALTRGWVTPRGVMPHYWSAAEALLLQMDMLAYVDQGAANRPLVIGAGVPADWLQSSIDTGVIRTPDGPVRWIWSNKVLTVWTDVDASRIKLADVFGDTRAVVKKFSR